MRAVQQLLLPDPQPLVERFGRNFFRHLPERPGVYVMRNDAGAILYVGKAKNLRRRLASYRVANPARMPRRHLRLLRAVAHIELLECADETAALAKEAELLRLHRPPFNRAGTWPGPPRFLAWRCDDVLLQLSVHDEALPDWRCHGPLGAGVFPFRSALARLLRFKLADRCGYTDFPAGWFHHSRRVPYTLHCGRRATALLAQLEALLDGNGDGFADWILHGLPADLHPFEQSAIDADLEYVADTVARLPRIANDGLQGSALRNDQIQQDTR